MPEETEQCPSCGAALVEPAAAASAGPDGAPPEAEHEALVQDASVEDGLLGGGSDGEAHETTASVPRSRVYEDESGAQFIDRRLGPDPRLFEAEDGTRYFERGTPTRALAGAIAAACVLGALFFAFLYQGAAEAGGSVSALESLFAVIDTIPLGNLLVALVLLGVGARTAVIASRGREYVEIVE